MQNDPPVEEIISQTLNGVLIRMTEINNIDRAVLYQEFKEWIIHADEKDFNQEVLCLKLLKNDN